jgi:hypothetical protein
MKYVPRETNLDAAEKALDKTVRQNLGLVKEEEIATITGVLGLFLSHYLSCTSENYTLDPWAYNKALQNLFNSSKLNFLQGSFDEMTTELILVEFITEYLNHTTPKEAL